MKFSELIKIIREKSGKEKVSIEESLELLGDDGEKKRAFMNFMYCFRLIEEIENGNLCYVFSVFSNISDDSKGNDGLLWCYTKDFSASLKMGVFMEIHLIRYMNELKQQIKSSNKLDLLNSFNKEFMNFSENYKSKIVELLGIGDLVNVKMSDSTH